MSDSIAAIASAGPALPRFATAFRPVGYWLIKHEFEPVPLLLGMVPGPLMEENLRGAPLISRGDWSVFLTRPLSAVRIAAAGLLAPAAANVAAQARRGVRKRQAA